jgi:hypothetical protein
VKSIMDENRTRDGFASANSRPGDQRVHMGKDEGELMSRLTYQEKYKMISLLSISTPRFEQPSRTSRVTRITRTSRRSLSHRLSDLLRTPFSLFSVECLCNSRVVWILASSRTESIGLSREEKGLFFVGGSRRPPRSSDIRHEPCQLQLMYFD